MIFDDGLDAIAQAPDLLERSKSFSVWKYGATRGVERLCEAFAGVDISDQLVRAGQRGVEPCRLLRAVGPGQEIESHGWAFERYDALPAPEALELLKRCRERLGCPAACQAVSGCQRETGRATSTPCSRPATPGRPRSMATTCLIRTHPG